MKTKNIFTLGALLLSIRTMRQLSMNLSQGHHFRRCKAKGFHADNIGMNN